MKIWWATSHSTSRSDTHTHVCLICLRRFQESTFWCHIVHAKCIKTIKLLDFQSSEASSESQLTWVFTLSLQCSAVFRKEHFQWLCPNIHTSVLVPLNCTFTLTPNSNSRADSIPLQSKCIFILDAARLQSITAPAIWIKIRRTSIFTGCCMHDASTEHKTGHVRRKNKLKHLFYFENKEENSILTAYHILLLHWQQQYTLLSGEITSHQKQVTLLLHYYLSM